MRAVMLAALVACSHAAPKPSPSLVTITNWPERESVNCYFDEPPEPPEALVVGEGIGMERVVVHQRDWNALLAWLHDLRMHETQVKECLQALGAKPW